MTTLHRLYQMTQLITGNLTPDDKLWIWHIEGNYTFFSYPQQAQSMVVTTWVTIIQHNQPYSCIRYIFSITCSTTTTLSRERENRCFWLTYHLFAVLCPSWWKCPKTMSYIRLDFKSGSHWIWGLSAQMTPFKGPIFSFETVVPTSSFFFIQGSGPLSE